MSETTSSSAPSAGAPRGDILTVGDLGPEGILDALALSAPAARESVAGALSGKGAALVFEHPSARTRNASEMAVVQLGGHPVTIRGEEVGFDTRETVEDVARTLASFHALIGARVVKHETLERMTAALAGSGVDVPVINLLSNYEHPTQAIADLLTIADEFGELGGRTVAYIGDANNVCRSLAEACLMSGMSMRVAAPIGHGLSETDLRRMRGLGGELATTHDPLEAARGADVLYADVWVSMGDDGDPYAVKRAFAGFTIDEAMLDLAGPDAILLHCLPAHRGEEVTAAALEGPRSRVWKQAANRMHAARGMFAHALGVRRVPASTIGESPVVDAGS